RGPATPLQGGPRWWLDPLRIDPRLDGGRPLRAWTTAARDGHRLHGDLFASTADIQLQRSERLPRPHWAERCVGDQVLYRLTGGGNAHLRDRELVPVLTAHLLRPVVHRRLQQGISDQVG